MVLGHEHLTPWDSETASGFVGLVIGTEQVTIRPVNQCVSLRKQGSAFGAEGHSLHAVLYAALYAALYSGARGGRAPFARDARVMRYVLELRALQAGSAEGQDGRAAMCRWCGDVL